MNSRLIRFIDRARLEILALLGALLLCVLYKTWRWSGAGLLKSGGRIKLERPAVILFWHNRQLMMPGLHQRYFEKPKQNPVHTMISEHSDGRLIAKIVNYFNLRSVAGSSSRGGLRGLVRLIRLTREGQYTAITPDGPKGPKYELKAGVVSLQQATDALIYPMTVGASSYWQFGSWDGMILPKPFSKVVAWVGDPIRLDRNLDQQRVEEARKRLEELLKSLSHQSDRFFENLSETSKSLANSTQNS